MPDAEPLFQVLTLQDDESVLIEGGTLEWIPVRRRLGIRAFGINGYRAAKAGEPVIEDHVESPGQQEVYVVVQGRMRFVAGDDDEVEAPAGACVFVPDPTVRRRAEALEDDTIVLAVGGWPDRPYRPLPWEPIFLAQEAMRRGDWSAAAQTLDREAGEHRETAIVRFRLACCHAQLGDHERALEELRQAVAANPAMGERAEREELLEPLRAVDGWAQAFA